jgi:Tol biopolymer transport system component
MSGDGRYVAFASEADNLVAGDTNKFRDVFVRDLATNTSMLVSVGPGGVQGNGVSSEPSLSSDGRFVAFSSTATNLVAGDTNKSSDTFVRDLQTGITVLASAKPNGSWPGNKVSYFPTLSPDGRWLMFRSQATDLASGAFATGTENLFVRDLLNGTNYALTTAQAGEAVMSPSGRFIAFFTFATPARIHIWDSVSQTLVYTNAVSVVGKLAISGDGNFLAYTTASELRVVNRSAQTNWLVATGTFATGVVSRATLQLSVDGKWLTYARLVSPGWQTFLYDVQGRVETLVSHAFNSSSGGYGNSEFPVISPDGRFVAYGTTATNIVLGITGLPRQLVFYDHQTGLNELFSANLTIGGQGNDYSLRARFSADGQTLLFQSWASDLTPGDFNRSGDVFARPILTAVILPPVAGQSPWLYWPFLPGNNYAVEFKNTLADAAWQTLPGSYVTNGVKAWMQDGSPASDQRFYRINSY